MLNQRGNVLVLGILIGLLVAGGLVGAYYFGTKSQTTQPLQQVSTIIPTPTQESNQIQSPQPSVNNLPVTSNWKIYSDSQVAFKYPVEWNAKLTDSLNYGIIVSPNDLSNLQIDGGKWETIVIDADNQNIADEFTTDSTKTVISKDVTVNGLKGVEYTKTYLIDLPGINKGDVFIDTQLSNNGKKYIIELLDLKYKDAYQQILSTFKFVN